MKIEDIQIGKMYYVKEPHNWVRRAVVIEKANSELVVSFKNGNRWCTPTDIVAEVVYQEPQPTKRWYQFWK